MERRGIPLHGAGVSRTMFPTFTLLSGKRVVLASTSPRRRELFDRMAIEYDIVGSGFAEDLPHADYATPAAYSAATCLEKARSVLRATLEDSSKPAPSLIVSADTIVECNGRIYEKPADRADAGRMLRELSGQVLDVVTAVSLAFRVRVSPKPCEDDYEWLCFDDYTAMDMEILDEATIEAYLAAGQGMDHSAALSYQGAAFLMVRAVRGCFYNLIGFPAARFYRELTAIAPRIV